jgi:hypothetical protein
MRFAAPLLFASIAFAVVASFAGTMLPEKDDSEYVAYAKKFPYVAVLKCRSGETGESQVASCVLIDGRWAVTAAHVVDGMNEWVVVTDDGKQHVIEGVSIHADYRRGKHGAGDLAICRSKDDFGLPWYPPLYEGSDERGRVASIAGFGAVGTFRDGRTKPCDGVRRAGSNVVDEAGEGYLVCTAGGDRTTSLEFLIAPGDSGGGLFIGNRLAGVNSYVSTFGKSPPRGVHGDHSGHTRISDYRDWIRKEMRCDEGQPAVRGLTDRGRGLEEEEEGEQASQ